MVVADWADVRKRGKKKRGSAGPFLRHRLSKTETRAPLVCILGGELRVAAGGPAGRPKKQQAGRFTTLALFLPTIATKPVSRTIIEAWPTGVVEEERISHQDCWEKERAHPNQRRAKEERVGERGLEALAGACLPNVCVRALATALLQRKPWKVRCGRCGLRPWMWAGRAGMQAT